MAYCLVIQPYFQRDLLFVNKGLLTQPPPPPFLISEYYKVQPWDESLTSYVALFWVEVGQP